MMMMLMMMLMMMMTTMMKLMTQMLLLTKSLNNEASAVHVFCGFECYISLWHICNVTYSCLQLCIDLSVNLQAGVEHATQQWMINLLDDFCTGFLSIVFSDER